MMNEKSKSDQGSLDSGIREEGTLEPKKMQRAFDVQDDDVQTKAIERRDYKVDQAPDPTKMRRDDLSELQKAGYGSAPEPTEK